MLTSRLMFQLRRGELVPPEAVFGFAVVAALIYWTDILTLLFPGGDGSSNATFRTIYFVIYGVTGYFLVTRLAATLSVVSSLPLHIALLGLCFLSAVWSLNPQESLQRSVAVLGSSSFGIFFATHINQRRALGLLTLTAALAGFLSLFLIVAIPSIGITQTEEYFGTWKGAHGHKNGFGQMTALGAVTCLLAVINLSGRIRTIGIGGFVLNLGLLAGSRSLTSQILFAVCAVALFVVGPLIQTIVRNIWVSAAGAAFAALWLGLTLSTSDLSEIMGWFGKDANMSSRLPLWESLLPFIAERFWLGYGYAAFWSEGMYTVLVVAEKIHFRPYYAHNGIIELWIGLGAAGVIIFAGAFLRYMQLVLMLLFRNATNPIYLLGFAFLIIMVLQNISESTILQRNAMNWTLFVMLSAYLTMDARALARRDARSEAVGADGVPGRLLVV
jgi:exopolysaccharide production protein ExoQ